MKALRYLHNSSLPKSLFYLSARLHERVGESSREKFFKNYVVLLINGKLPASANFQRGFCVFSFAFLRGRFTTVVAGKIGRIIEIKIFSDPKYFGI